MTNLTFAELQSFLAGLGFHLRTIPGSHHLFEHKDFDSCLVLRLYQPEEPIEQAGLVYIRHMLDQRNIMDRDEFDKQIRQFSLAG